MNPKTTIPILLCGMLLGSGCKNEQHTLPPTQPPMEPGESAIDDELAPPEDPEEMTTIPPGEAVEEQRAAEEEEIE